MVPGRLISGADLRVEMSTIVRNDDATTLRGMRGNPGHTEGGRSRRCMVRGTFQFSESSIFLPCDEALASDRLAELTG